MNKTDLKLLERCFSAEIDYALKGTPLPFKTRSKRMVMLAERGLVEEITEVLPGRGAVRILSDLQGCAWMIEGSLLADLRSFVAHQANEARHPYTCGRCSPPERDEFPLMPGEAGQAGVLTKTPGSG